MTRIDQGAGTQSEEALEALLRHATPRPTPSESDEAAVRRAVRAEWQVVSGKYRSRRRVAAFAIAATVLLGVFSVFNLFRLPAVDAVQVATIQKSFGSIYLLGEAAELRETDTLSNIVSGQTIVTGDNAGMALAWGEGGSLRIDASSRVRFVDSSSIFLDTGRVYFDSSPSSLMTGISAHSVGDFVVVSEFGKVEHIGTQFMTRVGDGKLTVTVREGQVALEGPNLQQVASAGEQLTISSRQKPVVLSIGRSGESWAWISRTSPAADVDGKSLHEFLLWACRETGLELRYEGRAEQVARHDAILKGIIDTEPLDALRLRLATAALDWRIDEGVITVSEFR